MRALVIGANGQLGSELVRALTARGVPVTIAGRDRCDLSRPAEAARFVASSGADLVINAAAYTAVDAAQSEPLLAETINAEAPIRMAEAAASVGALFVHYSTDYVFDGRGVRPYVEEDEARPLSIYGLSKRRGEEGVLAVGAPALIFRTSWLYARRGGNFMNTMVRLAAEGKPLRVVDDQWGAPTWARSVAEGSVAVFDRLAVAGGSPADAVADVGGIYHMSCGGRTTWCRFAEALFARHGIDASVTPLETVDYPTPAPRPLWSVMSNEKLAATFGVRLPAWEEALTRCLAEPA